MSNYNIEILGPRGLKGAIGQCPQCKGNKIWWDPTTDSCVCLDCGWPKSEKEATAMQVSYNGFTGGELVKLERSFCRPEIYDLSIYDSEKQVTHSFTGVKMEDMKFLGGAVTFGG